MQKKIKLKKTLSRKIIIIIIEMSITGDENQIATTSSSSSSLIDNDLEIEKLFENVSLLS
jgi:hypothetical protein